MEINSSLIAGTLRHKDLSQCLTLARRDRTGPQTALGGEQTDAGRGPCPLTDCCFIPAC